jgi:hypothetical protein
MTPHEEWIERARAVPIEKIAAERNLGLKRIANNELGGPCPQCGGHDRFSINTAKQVFNCRTCQPALNERLRHGAIDLVMFLDRSKFSDAVEKLAGPPPSTDRTAAKANGAKHPKQSATKEKVPVKTSDYLGEDGTLLLQVLRYRFRYPDGTLVTDENGKSKKGFSQRRPNPEEPAAWIWGISEGEYMRNGPGHYWTPFDQEKFDKKPTTRQRKHFPAVKVVPYRLPEINEGMSLDRQVFVVEGEPKADALFEWNLYATCNAGGAGKWLKEHAAHLKGATVIILADNDEIGRKHAEAVAHTLVNIAVKIKIVALPGLPPKGDIIDWQKAGHTREELDTLVEQTPEWQPAAGVLQDEDGLHENPGPEPNDVPAQGHNIGLDEWDAGDDPGPIPPRQWLLASQFCRTFISSIVAGGGTGKSALRLLQFISLATGRSLTGQRVFRRCRVLLISLEDDTWEIQRRIDAVLRHHNIDRAELKGWLFCASPKLMKLAETGSKGGRSIGPLEGMVRDAIQRRQPDILSLDPYVKTHSLEENNSGDMDFVCDLLARMAIEYNIGVDSPHHARKGIVTPGDADSGRGSSGIKDAGRLVFTLTPMSSEEAATYGVAEEDRPLYVRLDGAKVNIIRRGGKATWFKLVGVPLNNGTPEYPSGDEIQTVEPWSPPDTFDGLADATLNAALTEIEKGLPDGQRYSNASATKEDRAAWGVVKKHCPTKTEAQCRKIVTAWVRTGLLVSRDYDDPTDRKKRKGLFVDEAKRPGTTTEA